MFSKLSKKRKLSTHVEEDNHAREIVESHNSNYTEAEVEGTHSSEEGENSSSGQEHLDSGYDTSSGDEASISSSEEGDSESESETDDQIVQAVELQDAAQRMLRKTRFNAVHNVFEPFRALGFVCNETPLAFSGGYMVSSIGNSFHVYKEYPLALISVGPHFKSRITALQMAKFGTRFILAASGRHIFKFRLFSNDPIGVMQVQAPLACMHVVGTYLVVVDQSKHCSLWDMVNCEMVRHFPLNYQANMVFHPATYLDKMLVACEGGELELWNFRTAKHIHTFGPFKQNTHVTAIAQSPMPDTLAIGLSNGTILIHNIDYDETLFSFTHEPGPVTALSFRTDGPEHLVSGSANGDIAVWDLKRRRLYDLVSQAHTGAVNTVHCRFQLPFVWSAGADNALMQHRFDQAGRLNELTQYSGHGEAATRVMFYDDYRDGGKILLSTGLDRALRITSMSHVPTKEVSQGSVKKQARSEGVDVSEARLNNFISMDTCYLREGDWATTVTAHANCPEVYIWKPTKYIIGDKPLRSSHYKRGEVAQVVAMSSCGNFCLVGSSAGRITVFNVQSGKEQREFSINDKDTEENSSGIAHASPVTGLCIMNTNSLLVSAAFDGELKFWKFKSRELLGSTRIGSSISILTPNASRTLVAVVTELDIHVIDTSTQRIVRSFPQAHHSRITAVAFSPDNRILVATAMNGHLKAWDLVSCTLVEWLQLEDAATSVCFDPNGLFLVSTHVSSPGLYLWANRLVYANAGMNQVTKPMPALLPTSSMPQDPDINDFESLDSNTEDEEEEEEEEIISSGEESADGNTNDVQVGMKRKIDQMVRGELKDESYRTLKDKSKYLVLSGLPQPRWYQLAFFDIIRERNRPNMPQVKKAAPFFLPVASGITPQFEINEEDDGLGPKKKLSVEEMFPESRIKTGKLLDDGNTRTKFMSAVALNDDIQAIQMLLQMRTAEVDFELRTVNTNNNGDLALLLDFLNRQLETQRNFEFLQGCMCVVLKAHSSVIMADNDLLERVDKMLKIHDKCWCRIEDAFNESLCLVRFLNGLVI